MKRELILSDVESLKAKSQQDGKYFLSNLIGYATEIFGTSEFQIKDSDGNLLFSGVKPSKTDSEQVEH